ncbi:transmembrane protein 44 isoform X3 [Phyllostomus discolor]|uniref:Transmembrane protein 44 isoform X3 n=1 Tax=Phyllostomus discolor TaxID=89673 RepID=A0A7E6D3Y7_9CHIR|nr:transmembrane protein 44 isoform X3 [Phyllostomus discolor]
MEEAPSPAPALWNSDYLDHCFADHRVCISFGLWICACCCWIAAHALLLYLMCAKRSGQAQSALCAACCLLTSLCDTVGAILARQLTIQVFTGAYLAAVDLMNFVFILFPICGSKFKSNLGHRSQERKRRQRLRASVFVLMLPLSLGPCWALWAAAPKASGLVQGPQRRLLGSLLQCRGKTFSSIHLWARLLLALAGLLYASAIVAHDRSPEYLLRATPWFLTSLGRAALDLAIIFLSCVMKSKMRTALGFASEARESPDTQALLTCAEKEEDNEEARNENLDWVPLTTLPHCKSLRATAAISRYMELTIEPVQQAAAPPGCRGMDRCAREPCPCRNPPRTLPFESSGPVCPPAAPPRSLPSTPTLRLAAAQPTRHSQSSQTDTCRFRALSEHVSQALRAVPEDESQVQSRPSRTDSGILEAWSGTNHAVKALPGSGSLEDFILNL